MQVEATLSTITSGQTPPIFQSSYPFFQIPTDPSMSSSNALASAPVQADLQHHYHHHYSTPSVCSNALISEPLRDLLSSWLDELEHNNAPSLELRLDSLSSSEVNSIKLETTFDSEFPQPPSTVAEDTGHLQGVELYTAHSLLPSPGIYYTTVLPECHPPPHAASSSRATSRAHVASNAVSSRPSVTPALVGLLPPVARAKQLLQSAIHLFCIRPVPFPACLFSSISDESGVAGESDRGQLPSKKGKKKARLPSLATRWDTFELRALCLIGSRGSSYGTSSTKSDRRQREELTARARKLFFGDTVSSIPIAEPLARSWTQKEVPNRDPEVGRDVTERERPAKGQGESLPFFATVCMVLAIGAASLKASEKGAMRTPGRTLKQEMESPEFFHALAQQSLDVWEKSMTVVSPPSRDDIGTSKTSHVIEEEKLDYLVASLLGVGYQLYESHLKTESRSDRQRRKNDLNKLMPLVAKMVNMARVFGLGKARKSSTRYKDEELGGSRENPREDNRKRGKVWERRRRKDNLERLIWWDMVFYELFISDVLGHSSLISTSCPVELPCCPGSPLHIEEDDNDQENPTIVEDDGYDFHDVVEIYHGARCRLTKITQMIKHKLANSDSCCGYTLDQAAGLEAEIARFLEDLPLPLRFTTTEGERGDYFTTQSEDKSLAGADEFEKVTLKAHRCALAIMTQRLIIMTYLPFLPQHPTLPSSSSTGSDSSSPTSRIDDVGKKGGNTRWNPVLRPIISAAQCIIQASLQLNVCKAGQSSRHTLPLLLELYPVEKAVLDAVLICTYVCTSHSPLTDSRKAADSAISGMRMLWNLDLGPECKLLFDRLKKRYHTAPNSIPAHGVKRKHEQITIAGDGGYNSEPRKPDAYLGSDGNASASQTLKSQFSAHQQQWPQRRIVHDTLAGSVDNRDPETGQKNKKHAKKIHPPIGIRLRQGKMRLFLTHRTEPSPESSSNVEVDGHRELPSPLPFITPSTENGQQQQQLTSHTEIRPIPEQQQIPQVDHDLPTVPFRGPSRLGPQEHLHAHPPNSQHNSPQAMAFTVPFEDSDIQLRMNDAHFGVHSGEPSPQGNNLNMSLHPGLFEGNGDHERQRPSLSPAYLQRTSSATVQSSPYGSPGHPSPTGLSYATNTTVIPAPAPSFVRAPGAVTPHQTTASTYAHAYYHMDSTGSFGVNNPHSHTHGQENVSYTGVGLGTASGLSPSIVNGSPVGDIGIAAAVPSPPVYEKTQAMDALVQQQQLHHRHQMLQHQTTYSIDQRQRHSMTMTQTWSPQIPPATNGPQRLWIPPAEDFKYYN
ncbi:hypothetical protein AX15_000281 [Amanita polypyramis BW_CC]|nr:hypothetical protein AX15_000281 [Amanita polypyramis BW_CC]